MPDLRTALRCFTSAALITVCSASAKAQELGQTHFDLIPSTGQSPQPGSRFGAAVAMNDQFIVVGAIHDERVAGSGMQTGAVHVFSAKTGRWLRRIQPTDLLDGAHFGQALAIDGTRLLVGAPNVGSEPDTASGVAYLMDLRNGRQLKKLMPDVVEKDAAFGSAVALTGNLALVGAPAATNPNQVDLPGRVYAFDVSQRGSVLASFANLESPNSIVTSSNFGTSLATDGRLLLVGAPAANGGRGAAFLYHLVQDQFEFLAPLGAGSAPGDHYGQSVAMLHDQIAIGAPGAVTEEGRVTVFHLPDVDTPKAVLAPSGLGVQGLGSSLAFFGRTLIAGAPDSENGKGVVFFFGQDRYDTPIEPVANTLTTEFAEEDFNGLAVAAYGNGYVIASSEVANGAPETGKARASLLVPQPIPAIEGPNANQHLSLADRAVSSLPIPRLGDDNELSYLTQRRGKAEGVFRYRFDLDEPVRLLGNGSSGLFDDNSVVRNLGAPSGMRRELNLFRAQLSGPAATNQALMLSLGDLNDAVPVLRDGQVIPELGAGTTLSRFLNFTQQSSTIDLGGSPEEFLDFVVSYRLRRGAGNVNKGNDSGLLFMDKLGQVVSTPTNGGVRMREGEPLGSDRFFGQFNGLASLSSSAIISLSSTSPYFHTGGFVIDDNGTDRPISSHAILYDSVVRPDLGNEGLPTTLGTTVEQRQTTDARGLPGATYQTFPAFTSSGYWGVFRATLVRSPGGPSISSANNEGLFHENFSTGLLLRKGQSLDPTHPSSPRVSRILQFWSIEQYDTMALIRLGGPGVSSANDLALVHLRGDQIPLVLLREGEATGDSDGSRIRVIQRIDVQPISGDYTVLASLTGSKTANQAVFTGNAFPDDTDALGPLLRLPHLWLRKGQLKETSGQPLPILGFAMPVTTDRTGAGGRGNGQLVNRNGLNTLTLDFGRAVGRRIVVGRR